MKLAAMVHFFLALGLCPLLLGVINRVKALVAGRTGPPLIQTYYDLSKLLAKGAVYSTTATWVLKLGPLGVLAALWAALLLLPAGTIPALAAFPGDLFVFVYLLGLSRFCMVMAALDTGSPFEGMGASREAALSALAEPALMAGLLVFVQRSGGLSLSAMFGPALASSQAGIQAPAAPILVLVSAALFILLLAENARIPVDDPNTHLELTMIHEVMILDHGGPDLGLLLYAQALKLWITAGLFLNVTGLNALARSDWEGLGLHLAGILAVAVVVGLVESGMARLRMNRLPQILVSAGALSTLALLLLWR
jgi:formate hydrogenlyase subunit 4